MAQLLTSWKEIAAYLGKGVRTVQRWERQLGLPVRRPDASLRNVVFAVPDELDAWVISASLHDPSLELATEATLRLRVKQLEIEVALLRNQVAAVTAQTVKRQLRVMRKRRKPDPRGDQLIATENVQ